MVIVFRVILIASLGVGFVWGQSTCAFSAGENSKAGAASDSLTGMVRLVVSDRSVEGEVLHRCAKNYYLLGRDGRIWTVPRKRVDRVVKTAPEFEPYSVSQMRAMLLRELGSRFEVTGSIHYLVAHPKGQRDRWAKRFETLYRSFVRYFSVRGFDLKRPPFLLMAIVCHDRGEFSRYAKQQSMGASPGLLGFYSLDTNRVVLFDQGDGGKEEKAWESTCKVVLHEATHQIAFNTGINDRFCRPPLWVCEGLAMLFEAPGVYASNRYRLQKERINRGRYEDFVRLPELRDLTARMTASDRFFQAAPSAAYAEAWALTFFLTEAHPTKFNQYLRRMARRPKFKPYTARERLDDFQAVFGSDGPRFDAQFKRFFGRLDKPGS